MTITNHDYALGASEAEQARLLAQGEMHRREADLLIDRIGVGPGWRTIDIGCGPLGVLDILADRVGPSGAVVGLDNESRMLGLATSVLAERNLADVELVQADAADTGLPADSFDLVHERLVVLNVPNPEETVAEMVRLARPGGYVALQDFDAVSWLCEPPHPAWERLMTPFAAAWRAAGLDLTRSRTLPAMLRRAGLVDVEVDVHVHGASAGDRSAMLFPHLLGLFRERILALDALTEAELDDCLGALTSHLEQPGTFTIHPTLIQAWGRKPEHEDGGSR
jgi:ubiquinone/menaquinone biosynthesis C-methylase UbiE